MFENWEHFFFYTAADNAGKNGIGSMWQNAVESRKRNLHFSLERKFTGC
jgi:hypothetical protein